MRRETIEATVDKNELYFGVNGFVYIVNMDSGKVKTVKSKKADTFKFKKVALS
jgi:hypothetical protein